MRFFPVVRTALAIIGLFGANCSLYAQTPATEAPAPPGKEVQGMPARATPDEYLSKGKAGTVTVAAEFLGHSVPTPQGTLTTEDYVVVETALFGPADSKIKVSAADFAIRINGRKMPVPSTPYGLVLKTLKDPELEPLSSAKSKTSMDSSGGGGGGAGQSSTAPPAPVKIPFPVLRAMGLRVTKESLPEGERMLPQAGLIFFAYRGKAQGIHSVELIYEGPAGKTSLNLQP